MSDIISKSLLKIVNEIGDMESTISKIDAAIFVRNNDKVINEKVAYLYNLLISECNVYFQKSDEYYDKINLIISNYKTKLNTLYDEFYCQYVNIQNEIQEARINKKIALINYQKLINDKEKVVSSEEYQNFIDKKKELIYKLQISNDQKEYNEVYNTINSLKSPVKNDEDLKKALIEKSKLYDEIIEKCKEQFNKCKENFESKIDKLFLIDANLEVINENNIFQKLRNKIVYLFLGKKKFEEVLDNYNQKIQLINERNVIDEIRNETIDFVTDILELRNLNEDELKQIS